MIPEIAIFWFRRDLRLADNRALYEALNCGLPVLPIFIFDTDILNKLENQDDSRVTFIHSTLSDINKKLLSENSSLVCLHSDVKTAFEKILHSYNIKKVFFNKDYEPYTTARDQEITQLLKKKNIDVCSFKDHVIFEPHEILKKNNLPYTVFTPYSKKWKENIRPESYKIFPSEKLTVNFLKQNYNSIPALSKLGFKRSSIKFPKAQLNMKFLQEYAKKRNFPATDGTSRIGVYLRFGAISTRECFRLAEKHSEVWMNELIWREFFLMIMSNFPHVKDNAFKAKYDLINWENDEEKFELWCKGKTGFPIVDAGMRELVSTGFMHNRVRMITASFLVKDLLIDWRWGEAFFAKHLLDYDLSINNGNWQWAAGCGTDAAPYFRIFNPDVQAKKFDPKSEYIKKWIPEFGTEKYCPKIIDHKEARGRCLAAYKKALNNN